VHEKWAIIATQTSRLRDLRAINKSRNSTTFSRIIVMAQDLNLHMADALSHPLDSLPLALATPEGLLRKTNVPVLSSLANTHLS